MKTYLWLLFCFLLVPPFSLFSSLMCLSPTFFLCLPLIYLPLSSLSHFLHFSIPLLHPFLSSFISLPPISPLSHLSTSVSEHYRAVRVNGVPVSSTGQVMNLSPSSGAQRHGALLSPGSVGAGQSGMEIGRCRSRLVWRDHHTGSSSACNVGWHTADCSTIGAGSKS